MFELSFRDERYLPFEGAGAISGWSLELFNDCRQTTQMPRTRFWKPLRQFDYGTIADAVLHVKYTAREDAARSRTRRSSTSATISAQAGTTPSFRLLNLRQEFPTQWYRFLNPTNPANGNVLELEMSPSLFPFRDEKKTVKVNSVWLLARCKDGENYAAALNPPLAPPPVGADTFKLVQINQYGRLHFGQKDVSTANVIIDLAAASVKWQFKMTNDNPTTADGNLESDPSGS